MLEAADLLIEIAYPRQGGGQYVGTGDPTIRVTHLPTGTIAICGIHHSQFKNRTVALEMIEWALTT